MRLVLFLNWHWFGVCLSLRGRGRGKRKKSDQAGKIFQQDFSRMATGAAKHKSMFTFRRVRLAPAGRRATDLGSRQSNNFRQETFL